MDSFYWGYLKGKFDGKIDLTIERIKEVISSEIQNLNRENQGFLLAAIDRKEYIASV